MKSIGSSNFRERNQDSSRRSKNSSYPIDILPTTDKTGLECLELSIREVISVLNGYKMEFSRQTSHGRGIKQEIGHKIDNFMKDLRIDVNQMNDFILQERKKDITAMEQQISHDKANKQNFSSGKHFGNMKRLQNLKQKHDMERKQWCSSGRKPDLERFCIILVFYLKRVCEALGKSFDFKSEMKSATNNKKKDGNGEGFDDWMSKYHQNHQNNKKMDEKTTTFDENPGFSNQNNQNIPTFDQNPGFANQHLPIFEQNIQNSDEIEQKRLILAKEEKEAETLRLEIAKKSMEMQMIEENLKNLRVRQKKMSEDLQQMKNSAKPQQSIQKTEQIIQKNDKIRQKPENFDQILQKNEQIKQSIQKTEQIKQSIQKNEQIKQSIQSNSNPKRNFDTFSSQNSEIPIQNNSPKRIKKEEEDDDQKEEEEISFQVPNPSSFDDEDEEDEVIIFNC